jgi:hypothetical protein
VLYQLSYLTGTRFFSCFLEIQADMSIMLTPDPTCQEKKGLPGEARSRVSRRDQLFKGNRTTTMVNSIPVDHTRKEQKPNSTTHAHDTQRSLVVIHLKRSAATPATRWR